MFLRSRFFVSTLCCLAGALSSQVSAAEVVAYDLRGAFAAVEDASVSVLLSREALAQAIESANNSRAALLPDVTLDASQRRSQSASVGANVTRAGITDRFDATLNGRLNLLDPQVIATYQAAKKSINVAELDLAATRETILATVAQAYFTHLRNIERLTVFDANIERARALLNLAQRQADAGVATQIDVTRAQAQLASAQQDRLQQETVVATSDLRFKRLLGIEASLVLALEPFTVQARQPAPFSPVMAETAFERRADLLSSAARLEQNELEVRAAKYNRLPALGLNGSYGYATERVLDGNEANIWSTAVTFSVPIFDGARTGSLTRLALSRRRAQEARVKDLEFGIIAEVRLAVQNASSRAEQVDVAEMSQRLAEEELRLAQTRFEQGVADNREIVEAQNRLALASDNLVEAKYQYKLSRVELARATGDVSEVLALDQS